MKLSLVGAFPCLPNAFSLLICISVFLDTNLVPSVCIPPYKWLPPYLIKWLVVSFHVEEHNGNNRLAYANGDFMYSYCGFFSDHSSWGYLDQCHVPPHMK